MDVVVVQSGQHGSTRGVERFLAAPRREFASDLLDPRPTRTSTVAPSSVVARWISMRRKAFRRRCDAPRRCRRPAVARRARRRRLRGAIGVLDSDDSSGSAA
ncbi:hypothetical protein I552_7878 [Mycobacterium xenopi 3993]|nr:hypothetical protein I552_7878 [Mycobacterium xenopi 3993]